MGCLSPPRRRKRPAASPKHHCARGAQALAIFYRRMLTHTQSSTAPPPPAPHSSRKKDLTLGLGLASGSETCIVALDRGDTMLTWRALKGGGDDGGMPMSRIGRIVPEGEKGVSVLNKQGKREVEFTAQTPHERDEWLHAMQTVLMEGAGASPKKKAKKEERLSDQRQSDPAADAYWEQRKKGLDARQKQAEARRAKYAKGGMRHTAAIASRR
uniref:PH domain-containing protein n=1 Tax=Phaeomonas parva TaxID=124430 RepID=A0A7S1U9Q2_9STRA|mmetsp:Transcript_35023/g.110166  ORF Transcript_35023/g.110166 Transcript_35023/m.110166 type:complete len:213 (+) Transcript_35023:186-824(+)